MATHNTEREDVEKMMGAHEAAGAEGEEDVIEGEEEVDVEEEEDVIVIGEEPSTPCRKKVSANPSTRKYHVGFHQTE